jgi:hypothetical protein
MPSCRQFCLTNTHSQAQYFSILLSKVAIDAGVFSPLGNNLLHLSPLASRDRWQFCLLVSPLFSEPKLVSGSGIALPAAALRVPPIIIKHRDGHKNQLTSE